MWDQVEQSLHSSMGRVMNQIATLLPGILAFIVAFLCFLLIGWLLSALLRLILAAVRFDERVNRGGSAIAEWTPRVTPSLLMARIVFWCFVVVGVMVGVSAFEAGTSEHIVSGWILGYVPRIVGAAILLLAGNVLARFVSRSVLITGVNLNLSYARLLSMGVRWMILVLTGAMVLDHLALGGAIVELGFGILFGGIVLALSLAVGLGSRDLVSRSLEREATRPMEAPQPERVHHF
jgi:Conserved TM helix